MKKSFILLGVTTLINTVLFAQTPIRLNYYLDHNYLQNAASNQLDSAKWKVNFYSQYKFTKDHTPDWKKAPLLAADAHLKVKDVGVISFLISNDNYSYFNRTQLGVGYSYRYEKNGWFLQPGIRVITNFDAVNLSKIHIPNQTFNNNTQLKVLADIDFGLVMGWKNLEVQAAYNNLTKSEYEVKRQTILSNKPNWVVGAKYRFDIGEKWEITPFAQVYHERQMSYDIGIQGGMKNLIKLGYQVRLLNLNHIYHVNVQATKALQIRAAVGHSMLTSDINAELGISYKLY